LQELFLLCPTSTLDTKDIHGDYLIGIAAQCGFLEVVKMLLDKNVSVNFPNVILFFWKKSLIFFK